MARLYGKGTLIEIVRGKKYRIKFSGGKNPLSGRVYASNDKVPDKAFAIDANGKQVKPKVIYGKASKEQRESFERWKTPVEYYQITETFLGTKRQAQLRVEEIRRELESGKAINADKVTFAELAEQYTSMREGMGNRRENTLRKERSTVRHLLDVLGSTRIVDITPAVIGTMYVNMRTSGMGNSALVQCHGLLSRIMKYAVDNDLITRNPCDRVEAPKNPKPKRQSLGTEDAARMLGICASGTPTANKTAVFLGLSLGARLGEVLGLTWGHVVLDDARPFAHIVQQHTRYNTRTPLKTDSDENPIGRIVPLDASTVALLMAWKAEQRHLLNEYGIEQGSDTPIVTSTEGCWMGHAKFEKWFRGFCAENGYGQWVADDGTRIVDLCVGDVAEMYPDCIIEWRDSDGWPCDENGKRYSRTYKRPTIRRHYEGLVFHELRHSHFTMRLASGMDIPTAQALGGWSTPSMLLNVYAHPLAENIWASAGFVDNLTARPNAKQTANQTA